MSLLGMPLTYTKLPLKNRLVMPPLATGKAQPNGIVTDNLLAYYNEKSQGGYLSLIIIEHSYIAWQGKASSHQLSSADDAVIEGLRQLSTLIHKNGSKAVMQISHAGSATSTEVIGEEPVGPSAIANPRKGDVPRPLSAAEITEIVRQFAAAALRVKQAGFDGVEIHSAHGYLLNQFLSPLTNKRTDAYGGDILGRIRIHLEVIKAVREAVGVDFPIFLRLGAADFAEGGTTIADSKIAVAAFEKAGVDILDISGGFCGYTLPGVKDPGYFSPLSAEIKKVVSVPVIVAGGITEPVQAEKLLQEESADLIGVARAIYNDSSWAKRAIEEL